MTDVAGIGGSDSISRAQRTTPGARAEPGRSDAERARREGDRVELSPTARELQARDGLREDLVAQVRERIEAGEYDSAQRLDEALDRLIDETT